MKRFMLAAAVVMAIAAIGGCGAKKAPVTITNDLGAWDIYYVYVSSSDSDDWGEDLFGEETILADGEEFSTEVNTGTYDIRVVDEDDDTYTKRDVEITEEGFTWDVTLADLD